MKYIIRERMFSIGNKFDIRDDYGKVRYIVEGKIFTLGKKLNIYDSNKNLLIKVEQKLLRLLDEYKVIENKKEVAKISRQISLLRPQYNINSIYGKYKVDGDILKYNFDILKGNKVVAKIRKQYLSLSDTYKVNIEDSEDHAFILALVIILDQVHHDGSKGGSTNID